MLTAIFYALIALFFGYLLYDAFGKPVGRTKPGPRRVRRFGGTNGPEAGGTEAKRQMAQGADQDTAPGGADQDDDPMLDEKCIAPGADRAQIEAGLFEIEQADDRFEIERFLTNAKRTLELMLTAFQARDREQLQLLLKSELYEAFDAAITDSEDRQDNAKLELVGLGDPRLLEAKMDDTMSVVVLTARLEQLIAKRDPDGGDVEGLGETVIETAEYTFVRDVNSDAPNWYLRSIEDV